MHVSQSAYDDSPATCYVAKPIDIEALLAWTYRDQRADKVLAHDNLRFDQERLAFGSCRAAESRDGVAAMARIGALGVRISGGGASASHLHPDAETVHDCVEAMGPPLSMLVIRYARHRARPADTPIPRPKASPVLYRGRPKIRYAEWDRHRTYGHCEIEWTVEPQEADALRREYRLWRSALAALAVVLGRAGRLIDHQPLPPAAPAEATIRYC